MCSNTKSLVSAYLVEGFAWLDCFSVVMVGKLNALLFEDVDINVLCGASGVVCT